jgi:hypothetical protein
MARYASLRASDNDRDAVAERLRQAAVEGRLEPDELEDRLHAALRARYYGELDALLVDLPARQPARRQPTAAAMPPALTVLATVLRVVAVLAILIVALAAVALSAAWWLIGLLIWLSVRASRGGCSRRTSWHVRRV